MSNGFQKIQKALTALAARINIEDKLRDTKKGLAIINKAVSNKEKLEESINKLNKIEQMKKEETDKWIVEPAELIENGGAFDACDLEHWMAISLSAKVPSVPIKKILSLTPKEFEYLIGNVDSQKMKLYLDSIKRKIDKIDYLNINGDSKKTEENNEELGEKTFEKLFSCLDEIPENWMVRNTKCGTLELKSLAGAGVIGETVPEVKFNENIEVGPGWVRVGNRRRVLFDDKRIISAFLEGNEGNVNFVARPWIKAARYFECEDPLRHGTVFAGKGIWPAEWRAFVEDGIVVGVSSYYGWIGEINSENAKIAIQVRDLAQKMVDKATELKAYPRYMNLEFIRNSSHELSEKDEKVLDIFKRESVSCTLDFLESEQGLVFLEGGPAHTPFGGGHPCSFAGNFNKEDNRYMNVHGVAFKLLKNVNLADFSTWKNADASESILNWDEVENLAYSTQLNI